MRGQSLLPVTLFRNARNCRFSGRGLVLRGQSGGHPRQSQAEQCENQPPPRFSDRHAIPNLLPRACVIAGVVASKMFIRANLLQSIQPLRRRRDRPANQRSIQFQWNRDSASNGLSIDYRTITLMYYQFLFFILDYIGLI